MSNKKPSNARCKAKKILSNKTVRGAMVNNGKRYRKGPTLITVKLPDK